jgi:ribosomal protein S28E/S33
VSITLDRHARADNSGHVGRLAEHFAKATGRTPMSGSQRLTGKDRLINDAVAYLTACRQLQQLADGELFLHQCSEAFRGGQPEAWRPELVEEIAQLDGVEDGRLTTIALRVQNGVATETEVRDYARLLMREIAGKVRLYDSAIALTHQLREARA